MHTIDDCNCNAEQKLTNDAGALAIHCKAGLGRTGVLICSYLIKHHDFTPEEAIGYIRVCRPGSVIGLQQNHLLAKHAHLQQAGQLFRQQHQVATAITLSTMQEQLCQQCIRHASKIGYSSRVFALQLIAMFRTYSAFVR
jgi:hypothetical protein